MVRSRMMTGWRQPVHTIGRYSAGCSLPLRQDAKVVRGVEPTHPFHWAGQVRSVTYSIEQTFPISPVIVRPA
jgi:hypothetical protein